MSQFVSTAVEATRNSHPGVVRLRLEICGAVQGVGFRPFVHRLATTLGLSGWVANSGRGVTIEVEGEGALCHKFRRRLERDRPPHCFIHSLEAVYLDPAGHSGFVIRASDDSGGKTALVLPDIATCPECLAELFDPANRRHRHPFINCTHCGPRYSIIEAVPYDRPNTAMRGFTLCSRCQAEYDEPADRRFHAQPNACPDCGPSLAWWGPVGEPLLTREDALREAIRALRSGAIIAVKGIGGFHLLARASADPVVARLRERKRRGARPFAVMAPSLAAVRQLCRVDEPEAAALTSSVAPIVLLRRRREVEGVAAAVAPGNPWLGVMLPYSPLHHLLLAEVGDWVVATSGNLSDEPICIDNSEAVERLRGVADGFLVHDRPIVRHVDDSIVRVVLGREMVLRRARGLAPLPILLRDPVPPTLAVGAHLKNAVAVARGREVFLSQHIGDLETTTAFSAFERVVRDLARLTNIEPVQAARDLHPDYLSSQHASGCGLPNVCVQHHYAHALACMAENDLPAPVLGVSWDGTGFGPDGSIWGGEFLRITPEHVFRVGCLRPFRLAGGETAVVEPRRSALGLLYELFGESLFEMPHLAPLRAFAPKEQRLVRQALVSGVNAPKTTSAGRLFDGVASILDLRHMSQFEGQAAMDIEFAIEPDDSDEEYPVEVVVRPASGPGANGIPVPCPEHPGCLALAPVDDTLVADWGPMLQAMLGDLRAGVNLWLVAAKFHNTLAGLITAIARQVNEPRVLLSGGCFQNRYLLERTVARLKDAGFTPYWHQRVPPNDGGIALGQVVATGRRPPPGSCS